MIGQFKLKHMAVIWPTSRKHEQGKKKSTFGTPDYRIGNRPQTAEFKVMRNVNYVFLLYSIDSNLQDKIAGQDGVRKWTFCGESNYSFYILNLVHQ